MAKYLRCYMCSDLHAANRTYRKLLNAIKMNVYEANIVLIAGDLTGKFLGLPRLVWYGIVWLIFIIPVYLAAFVWPVIQAIQASKGASDFVSFSNTSGISWAIGIIVIAIAIYFVMKSVNNSRGINTKMIYQVLPPD